MSLTAEAALRSRVVEILSTKTPTAEHLIRDADLQKDLDELYAMSDAIEARADLEAWSDAIRVINDYWDGAFHD